MLGNRKIHQHELGLTIVNRIWMIIGLVIGTGGCTTPAPMGEDLFVLAQKEQKLGITLSQELDSKVRVVRDSKAEAYLKAIVLKLNPKRTLPKEQKALSSKANQTTQKKSNTPPQKENETQVTLFHSTKGAKCLNYSLPGKRIYLCLELLKALEYENEFAASLAIELGRLNQKQLVRRSAKFLAPGHLSLENLFNFSQDEEIQAARQAVKILYDSGYDPRGVVSFYQKLEENPDKGVSDVTLIREVILESRKEIAHQSPLRNPIVKSPAFIEIHRRIHTL